VKSLLRSKQSTLESLTPSVNFMKRWLAVSLVIPKESAEAVSNFLLEQGATGTEETDEGPGWEKLKAYFPEDGKEKRVLRALRSYLKSLQTINPEISRASLEAASIPEQDWGENWKKFFKPVQVTERFVVKPPWRVVKRKGNQIVVDIHPGMAFGTGTHASTKLAIRALEKTLKRREFSVLDVGTGSGILSIAAARLGAVEVCGLDTDGVAVENARENAKQNSVSHIVKIRKGRIGGIQKGFDVVVANIDYKRLRRMRTSLLRHLKPRGFLILSGILQRNRDRLRQHYMETGVFQWEKTAREQEWVCLTFKKK